MELGRIIEKSLQPIVRRLRTLATRGVVKLVDPSTLMQQLQVAALGDELLDSIEHWEPYGFTSNPNSGAEALLLSLGADRDHTVAVNVADRRFRLKGMASGEVAVYTDEGDVIHFQRGNELLVDTMGKLTANAGSSATVTAPTVTVNGNTTINGTLTVSGAVLSQTSVADPTGTMQAMRDTYNSHNHPENDSGGPTDAPNQTM